MFSELCHSRDNTVRIVYYHTVRIVQVCIHLVIHHALSKYVHCHSCGCPCIYYSVIYVVIHDVLSKSVQCHLHVLLQYALSKYYTVIHVVIQYALSYYVQYRLCVNTVRIVQVNSLHCKLVQVYADIMM